MIELKKQFSKRGINFNQIYKDGELVIYELAKPFADGDGRTVWYEVFRLMIKKSDIYHPDDFEKYPSDEAFGKWAWSCSNEDIVNKVLKREFPNHWMTKKEFRSQMSNTIQKIRAF